MKRRIPRIAFDAEWSLEQVEKAMCKQFGITKERLEELKQSKLAHAIHQLLSSQTISINDTDDRYRWGPKKSFDFH